MGEGGIPREPFSTLVLKITTLLTVRLQIGSNTDEGASFTSSGSNTTEEAKANLVNVPEDQQDTILAVYPDVPALGCPFNTGDFQLGPVQGGFPTPPGRLDKQVYAIVGDVVQAA